MSRKASDGSSRLKISNPQPLQNNSNNYNNATFSESGGHRAAPVPGQSAYVGSSNIGQPSPSLGVGPVRPARSNRRAPDPPAPTPITKTHEAGSTTNPTSGPSRITKADNYSSLQIPSSQADYDLAVSPISPVESTSLSNPAAFWKAEREQRSEMLEVQKQNRAREEKLQKAVNAFAIPSKSRSTTTKSSEKDQGESAPPADLLIGLGGRDFDDVDSVLRRIQRSWPFVLDPDFAPSSLALSLLSSAETARTESTPYGSQDLQSFLAIHGSLSNALSQAVQSHYQVYAASLPEHANLIGALDRAQGMVKSTKKKLKESKDYLSGRSDASLAGGTSGKRAEMVTLWHKERALRDMLKVLDTIDKLKQVPDRIESLITDKKFLQTALILKRAIKTINREEMLEIGALSDLRTHLVSQEGVLMDILVEELSNHLYLKSHYCNTRWLPYQVGQTELLVPADALQDPDDLAPRRRSSTGSIPAHNPRLSRFLRHLSHKPNRDPLLNMTDEELITLPAIPSAIRRRHAHENGAEEDTASFSSRYLEIQDTQSRINPEIDSYAYMEMLLESLAILGKLGPALDMLGSRIANELYGMVESTIEDVADRAEIRKAEAGAESAKQGSLEENYSSLEEAPPQAKRESLRPGTATVFSQEESLRVASLERGESEARTQTLLDLFWTIYSKFRAVLEGQRAVNEVLSRISMVNSYASEQQPFQPITTEAFVRPIQKEVRALLHGYLTDQDRKIVNNRTPTATINEVMRNNKAVRDRKKSLFRFDDTDSKTMKKDLTSYEESLVEAMRINVPGLVTSTEAGNQPRLVVAPSGERGVKGQHRLLVSPNPFNASILFQPYSAFVSSARETVNLSSLDDETGEIGTFMDDFIQKVYLPQLEEKVTSLFQQTVNGPKAFSRDLNWSRWSTCPLVNSGTQTIALVNSLCHMLSITPFQRENYSRLVIGIIVQYYQRSNAHYKDIVAADSYTGSQLPLAASLSQQEDLLNVLNQLQHSPADDTRAREALSQEETKLEQGVISVKHAKGIQIKDLIWTKEKFEALGDLYHTTRWIVTRLRELKHVREDLASPSGESLQDINPSDNDSGRPVLELTSAMAQRYDAILSTYEQFGDMILYTMRIELRCRLVYSIQTSLSKTNYRLDVAENEPDPHIQDLTADLANCETIASIAMPRSDRDFLFLGLDSLADEMLVSAGKFTRYMTTAGIGKIERNIAAIQQVLRNLLQHGHKVVLSHSQRYWSLYSVGPKAMIDTLQQGKPEYTFEEYNHMLDLQCKIDQRAANRLSVIPGHQANGVAGVGASSLIDLHSLFM